jgi:hypothetical protein
LLSQTGPDDRTEIAKRVSEKLTFQKKTRKGKPACGVKSKKQRTAKTSYDINVIVGIK